MVRVFGELGSLEWTQEHPDFLNYTPKGGATRVLTRTGNETDYPGGGNGRRRSATPRDCTYLETVVNNVLFR